MPLLSRLSASDDGADAASAQVSAPRMGVAASLSAQAFPRRKSAVRASHSVENAPGVFLSKSGRAKPTSQTFENTQHKAGKLTFITEEMRHRVLKHLMSLHRKKGIKPLKISRTIARRECMSEGDVRFILNGWILQYRAENAELRDGLKQAEQDIRLVVERLAESLDVAASAGAAVWRKGAA